MKKKPMETKFRFNIDESTGIVIEIIELK